MTWLEERLKATVTTRQVPSENGGVKSTSRRVPPTAFQLMFLGSRVEMTQPTFAPEVQFLFPMSAPSPLLVERSQNETVKLFE